MKLLNFTVIKLTACLILGILIGYFFSISFSSTLMTLSIALIGLIFSFIYSKFNYKMSSLFGGFAFITFIIIGLFTYTVSDETLNKHHYTNSNLNLDNHQNIRLRIEKRLKPDSYNTKFIAQIISINSNHFTGQVLVNLKKDSILSKLDIGTSYEFSSNLVEVKKPLNPFQFNYNDYLKKRQIYHQIYLEDSQLFLISTSSNTINTYANNFRKIVNTKLESAGFKGDALSIINALLLGQRQDISPDVYDNYINAGTIHILAVSGLHVGILLLILNSLLKSFNRIKYGRHYIKPILLVAALWSFAIIAGLSPSVTRAVTMFSVIAIAMHLKRKTNIYNTITISAFFILLCKPIYLFDIGFQMSYLAVIAIVSIQPILYKVWQPKYYLIDKPWQIFTVTIAAQLGVAPISLFYFHQFPGLFFISNVVIIPLLGLILGFGIFIIVLALINRLPPFLVEAFTYIIDSLNTFIAWIAQFENFLLREIPFTLFQVLSAYLIIIAGLRLWKRKTYTSLHLALLSLMLFLGLLVFNKIDNSTNEFVIFNKSRHSLLAEKKNDKLFVYHDLDSTKYRQDQTLKNYRIGAFIKHSSSDSLQSVYKFKNQTLLIIDSLGVYKVNFRPQYILLRNSPKLNLERLIDSIKPQQIIADASNYKSYVLRWRATCKAKKIPFHSTYEKGAFIIK